MRKLVVICAVLLLWACTPKSRPVQSPVKKAPTTEKPEVKPEGNTDTVGVGAVKTDTLKQNVPGETGGIKPEKRTPSLALILPFMSQGFQPSYSQQLPKNSDWAIGYYAGAKLALFDLERQGIKVRLQVFDNQGSPNKTQDLIADPELRKAELVIGPYLTKSVKVAAAGLGNLGIPLVIPYSASSSFGPGASPLLRMNPDLKAHLDGIAAYLNDNYTPEQVVLVGLPNGQQDREVAYLRKQQKVLSPLADGWRTWKLSSSEVGLQNLDWEEKFLEDQQTVFVFPAYQNPNLVLSFLSQLQIGREGRDATVVGMPQWKDFNQLDPSMLEDLGVTISAGYYIDKQRFEVKDFIAAYVDAYGALPQESAYLGYDALNFLAPLVDEYGSDWLQYLPNSYTGLATEYVLIPNRELGVDSTSEGSGVRYSNAKVRMLRYQNFAFRPFSK